MKRHPEERERAAVRRVGSLGFGWGLLVTLISSAGILVERLTQGDAHLAVAANALTSVVVMGAALALMRLGARPNLAAERGVTLLASLVLGAVTAIVAVHLALRVGVVAAPVWISERPRQLVNDLVAAFAIVALLWGSSQRPPRLSSVVLALGALTAYRFTAGAWHADLFTPESRALSVQEFVVAEVVGAAIALAIFRWSFAHEATDSC